MNSQRVPTLRQLRADMPGACLVCGQETEFALFLDDTFVTWMCFQCTSTRDPRRQAALVRAIVEGAQYDLGLIEVKRLAEMQILRELLEWQRVVGVPIRSVEQAFAIIRARSQGRSRTRHGQAP